MASPLAIIEVVEDLAIVSAAWALPENALGAVEDELAIANGPTAGVDSSGLRRPIELELVVGDNTTGATEGISEDTVLEAGHESSLFVAIALDNVSECAEQWLR